VARGSRQGRADSTTQEQARRRRRIGVGRLLGLAALMPLAGRAPIYGRLFFELIRDERMPAGRKALLAGALGYLVVGRDLLPDDIPIIGGLDDLVVVVLAVDLFLDGVPNDVLEEKLDELGIDARSFHEDVARIRRFTPSSLRRMLHRAPQLAGYASDAVRQSGVGPKVRAWIND
jgi:hypothetical protein